MPSISETVAIEKHDPCSHCLIVIERENPQLVHFDIYTGPFCMTQLLTKLEIIAQFFLLQETEVSKFHWSSSTQKDFSCCWTCHVALEIDNENVLDHCHFSVRFTESAHNECNPKRWIINYTWIIAHNLMNYDIHYIVMAIRTASRTTKFYVRATNNEKFIAMNFGIFTEKRMGKKGEVAVHEHLRFTDSFKFMSCKLEKFFEMLSDIKFSFLGSFFCWYTEDQRARLSKREMSHILMLTPF